MGIERFHCRPAAAGVLTAAAALWLSFATNANAGEASSGPLFASPFVPPPAKEGFAYPDCYCTGSEGERVEVGERACLMVGSRPMSAVCGMSQNSPAWRFEGEGCPVS